MRGPMYFILNPGKEFPRQIIFRVIIDTGGINIQNLPPENFFRRANIPDAGQQFIKIVTAPAALQAFIIQRKAINQIFAQSLGGPDAEMGAANTVNPLANRDNRVEVVIFQITGDLPFAFILNCCKFCNSCCVGQFA